MPGTAVTPPMPTASTVTCCATPGAIIAGNPPANEKVNPIGGVQM